MSFIEFPAGTVIPAGEVLLITNTAWEVASWSSLLQEEGRDGGSGGTCLVNRF